jgi:hypothetical protein
LSAEDLPGFAVAMTVVTALLSLALSTDFVLFYSFYWGITGLGCVLLLIALGVIVRERMGARGS